MRDLLPNVLRQRRDPQLSADPRALRRRSGVLARHDRFHRDGQGQALHVHHRPGRDQDGHARGGGQGTTWGARRRTTRAAAWRTSPPRTSRSDPLPRELLSYLPRTPGLAAVVPTRGSARPARRVAQASSRKPNKPYDIKEVIRAVVDDRHFLEVHEHSPQHRGRVSRGWPAERGRGGQPARGAGRVLDIDASRKAPAAFVRTCDAFNIPLVTFVERPGFLPERRRSGAASSRTAAKLLYAFSEGTVAKLTVIHAQGGMAGVTSDGVQGHIRSDVNLAGRPPRNRRDGAGRRGEHRVPERAGQGEGRGTPRRSWSRSTAITFATRQGGRARPWTR